ncbi:hypothetical protein B5S32_g1181 [[Candida] boidinii]|nr:hypothetical protein B5S32_g1181 [[Candida] boidinii]
MTRLPHYLFDQIPNEITDASALNSQIQNTESTYTPFPAIRRKQNNSATEQKKPKVKNLSVDTKLDNTKPTSIPIKVDDKLIAGFIPSKSVNLNRSEGSSQIPHYPTTSNPINISTPPPSSSSTNASKNITSNANVLTLPETKKESSRISSSPIYSEVSEKFNTLMTKPSTFYRSMNDKYLDHNTISNYMHDSSVSSAPPNIHTSSSFTHHTDDGNKVFNNSSDANSFVYSLGQNKIPSNNPHNNLSNLRNSQSSFHSPQKIENNTQYEHNSNNFHYNPSNFHQSPSNFNTSPSASRTNANQQVYTNINNNNNNNNINSNSNNNSNNSSNNRHSGSSHTEQHPFASLLHINRNSNNTREQNSDFTEVDPLADFSFSDSINSENPDTWNLDRVIFWLQRNEFNDTWVDVFRSRNIYGSDFLNMRNRESFNDILPFLDTSDNSTVERFLELVDPKKTEGEEAQNIEGSVSLNNPYRNPDESDGESAIDDDDDDDDDDASQGSGSVKNDDGVVVNYSERSATNKFVGNTLWSHSNQVNSSSNLSPDFSGSNSLNNFSIQSSINMSLEPQSDSSVYEDARAVETNSSRNNISDNANADRVNNNSHLDFSNRGYPTHRSASDSTVPSGYPNLKEQISVIDPVKKNETVRSVSDGARIDGVEPVNNVNTRKLADAVSSKLATMGFEDKFEEDDLDDFAFDYAENGGSFSSDADYVGSTLKPVKSAATLPALSMPSEPTLRRSNGEHDMVKKRPISTIEKYSYGTSPTLQSPLVGAKSGFFRRHHKSNSSSSTLTAYDISSKKHEKNESASSKGSITENNAPKTIFNKIFGKNKVPDLSHSKENRINDSPVSPSSIVSMQDLKRSDKIQTKSQPKSADGEKKRLSMFLGYGNNSDQIGDKKKKNMEDNDLYDHEKSVSSVSSSGLKKLRNKSVSSTAVDFAQQKLKFNSSVASLSENKRNEIEIDQLYKPIPKNDTLKTYVLITTDNISFIPINIGGVFSITELKNTISSALGVRELGPKTTFHLTDYGCDPGASIDDNLLEKLRMSSFVGGSLKLFIDHYKTKFLEPSKFGSYSSTLLSINSGSSSDIPLRSTPQYMLGTSNNHDVDYVNFKDTANLIQPIIENKSKDIHKPLELTLADIKSKVPETAASKGDKLSKKSTDTDFKDSFKQSSASSKASSFSSDSTFVSSTSLEMLRKKIESPISSTDKSRVIGTSTIKVKPQSSTNSKSFSVSRPERVDSVDLKARRTAPPPPSTNPSVRRKVGTLTSGSTQSIVTNSASPQTSISQSGKLRVKGKRKPPPGSGTELSAMQTIKKSISISRKGTLRSTSSKLAPKGFDPFKENDVSFANAPELEESDDNSGSDSDDGLFAKAPKSIDSKYSSGVRTQGSQESDSSSIMEVRPTAEYLYENIEVYFPDADLDKPIIDEVVSPPVSPIAEVPRPERKGIGQKVVRSAKQNENSGGNKIHRMKSIRIIAQEARQAAKTQQSALKRDGSVNLVRRRSTKMWGQKVVEVKPGASVSKYVNKRNIKGPYKEFAWVKGELIGKGSFGAVYLALNVTAGEMIAVKQTKIATMVFNGNEGNEAKAIETFKAEIDSLKDLDHINIVQYLGFEKTKDTYSIFLEYVSGGSVSRCIRAYGIFPEDLIRYLTKQVLEGLAYIHSKGILHRDLKADNLLLEPDGVCKISDFGISKKMENIYSNNSEMSFQGTIYWMAPEVINVKEHKGYSAKVDIWSLGCVVLEMVGGKRPWHNFNAGSAIYALFSMDTYSPIADETLSLIPPKTKSFLDLCFQKDPELRPTAQELLKNEFCSKVPADFDFTKTELAKKMREDNHLEVKKAEMMRKTISKRPSNPSR